MSAKGGILVVDDDLESLRLLTGLLTDESYDVRPADNGETALACAEADVPDLVLLDLYMPGLSGFDVCRRLKAGALTGDVPIIFISATRAAEDHVEGFRLGAVDFVMKPFQREELLARIESHLELHRLRVQLEREVVERTAELRLANDQLRHELAERKHAEGALRESEERFRNMADTAPVMIWVSGPDKLCTFFNKGWLTFRGRGMEQELGNGWAEGVHPDDLASCLSIYSTAVESRQPFQMEYRLRRADGEYRWVLDNGVPRFAPEGAFAGHIGSCIDITELKRSQEQRVAAQKLESLGALAAGIAHNFNNLLGAILSESDLALSEALSDSPLRESIERIGAVANRAAEIVDLLLAYSGSGEPPTIEPVDLSAAIEEMNLMARSQGYSQVIIHRKLPKGLPAVWTNRAQIQRVVMNLVTNACEALAGAGGSVTVSTELLHAGQGRQSPDLKAGDYIGITVADTGPGMAEEALAKIFDPFYTTKFLGRGLGLPVVQGIVRSMNGAIVVSSSPGEGAAFQVLLPCASQRIPAPAARAGSC